MSNKEPIEVDTKKLREVAIKNNENSISKLTDAIDKISDVKIPDDFSYKTELELLPNRIAGLQDTISDINRYIDKKAGEYDALQGKTLNWAPSYQGGVISPTGYTGYSTTTPEEREEQWRRLGATIFNIFGGFSEGATEMFIDGGTKAFDLAGGVCATPAWALIDIVKNGVTGGKANSHLLSDNWRDLMDRLASPGDLELQHQSEHEREESKRIDELAYGPFKYGGEGYKAIKGAGSVMGMIFGPGVAAGGATGATAGTSKVVSAISTFFTSTSRGASEYFTDKKNNSMDGIEEAYKSGDITKEEYETIKSIRNMSDEDWTKYENQVKNLSPQDPKYKDYTNIKKIREMPEEWKTLPNAVKGLTYGVGAGAWETGQLMLGLDMREYGTPFTRIALNTSLNSLDPAVRASLNTVLDGTSFDENFEKQGGERAMATNALIGGGLSALGEVVDYKARKGQNSSDTEIEISIKNEKQLKEQVLDKVASIEEEDLKSKAIYEELNKRVHYDMNFQIGDNNTKQAIINQNITADNVPANNAVVCKGWSELYCDLLQEEGIDAKVVKSNGRNHYWVEINLKNGESIAADATDLIGGQTDLVNSKVGNHSSGFIFINEQQKGTDPRDIFVLPWSEDRINEMDKKLGYATDDGYRFDHINTKLEDMFDSSFYDKLYRNSNDNSDVNLIKNTSIPSGMDGLEAYGYYQNIDRSLVELDYNELLYRKVDSGYEVVNYVSVDDYHQIYSDSLGRVKFNTEQEYENFCKQHDIKILKNY